MINSLCSAATRRRRLYDKMQALVSRPVVIVEGPFGNRATWSERAACANSDIGPEAWFPDLASDLDEPARRICAGCPVRSPCLRDALANPGTVGIWGGLDEREREQLRGHPSALTEAHT